MIGIAVVPFPSDEALRALWREAWRTGGPTSFQPILARSLAHIGAYDEEAQTLVGFVNIAWDGGIHAFVLDTCVREDYQRRGIATLMLKQAQRTARARGAQWLHVDYEPQLTSLYERCGFRATAAGLIAL